MKLTFLEAEIPLQKTFYLDAQRQVIDSKPYPMVRNFTSHEIEVSSLTEMFVEINKAAKQGMALLRGSLTKHLSEESRAGRTNKDVKTKWVLIDVDGVDIEPPLQNVQHIVQYSSSYKVKSDALSAHYFALCDSIDWKTLKQWMKWLNLDCYVDAIKVNRLGTALKWPLDISVCDPSKIIYITPPKLIDIASTQELADPLEQRMELVATGDGVVKVHVPGNVDTLEQQTKSQLLKTKDKSLVAKDGYKDILPNPPKAEVTGEKTERGFVYLNLNGGDSWGYYYPQDDPTVLYNFKGEPNYFLEQLAPEYWHKIRKEEIKEGKIDNGVYRTDKGLVISCVLENEDRYAYLEYDELGEDITKFLRFSARSRLNEKLKDVDLPQIDKAPCFEIVTDFQSDQVIDIKNRRINVFKKTQIFKNAVSNGLIPKDIDTVLRHLCTDDEVTYNHLIKWLAALIQYRKPLRTAWVFTGVQGTGKGVLFNIMQRIIGYEYTLNPLLGHFDDQFMSGSLDGKLFIMVDEADQESSKNAPNILAKLKQFITEDRITVRKMRQEAYLEHNNLNFIFCSNKRAPMEIELSDRRFNVAPYQAQRLIDVMSLEQINDGALSDEQIIHFAGFLLEQQIDLREVQKAINTPAKQELIETSLNSFSRTIEELKSGNLDYFIDNMPRLDGQIGWNIQAEETYKAQVFKILSGILDGERREFVHHVDEIKSLVEVITGNVYKGKGKFTIALRKEHYPIGNYHCIDKAKTVYGSKIRWSLSNKELGRQVLDELRGAM